MSEKLKTRPVVLEVTGEVKFAQHVLPLGLYTGMQQIGGTRTGAGLVWSEPTYTIRLTPEKLESLGWGLSRNLNYAAQDVSAAIRDGRIVVHL